MSEVKTQEEIQQEVRNLEAQLEHYKQVDPQNVDKHNELANQISELKYSIKQMQEREQGHVERVAVIADRFDSFLDHMDLGGMTLRQVIGGESEYQLASIGLKKEYTGQADYFSKQIVELQAVHSEQMRAAQEREMQLQRQNEELQKTISEDIGVTTDLLRKLRESDENGAQQVIMRQDAEKKRDNAVEALELAQIENKRLNSHIDDLRNEIALGARGAINVVDTAEEESKKKELADRIRKERTIYNKEWANPIKKDKFKAQKAIDGEYFEFPWTEETKYFVIDESEVQQFREQYGVQSNDQIPSVVEASIPNGVNQEVPFPSAPNVGTVHAPELGNQTQPTGVEMAEHSNDGEALEKTEAERIAELERRVEALEGKVA